VEQKTEMAGRILIGNSEGGIAAVHPKLRDGKGNVGAAADGGGADVRLTATDCVQPLLTVERTAADKWALRLAGGQPQLAGVANLVDLQ